MIILKILIQTEICEKTYYNWRKIDAEELPLFKEYEGGRQRLTTVEKDKIILDVARESENRGKTIKSLRNDPRIK